MVGRVGSTKIGLMGGTFDPIHVGHLLAASEAADALALDEVLFVPTGQSWQKSDQVVATTQDRVAMTALALEGDERFTLSLMEVQRSGPSYTIDSVNEIESARPGSDVFVIVGADAIRGVPTWHQSQSLIDEVHFIVMARAGHAIDAHEIPVKHFTIIQMPQLEISSSEIRHRIANGRSIQYLVPDNVVSYIATHHLYV